MRSHHRHGASQIGAAVATMVASAGFVLAARRTLGGPLGTPANAITLSRVLAAAGLAAQAAARARIPAVWFALVVGCTISDWLDGPLARRTVPTRLGATLDIEADSWLTLWAAVAAWRSGALPVWSVAAPLLRYPVRVGRAAHRSMGRRGWQRAAGVLQMATLVGALAPWAASRATAARVAPLAALAQLGALAADMSGGA